MVYLSQMDASGSTFTNLILMMIRTPAIYPPCAMPPSHHPRLIIYGLGIGAPLDKEPIRILTGMENLCSTTPVAVLLDLD